MKLVYKVDIYLAVFTIKLNYNKNKNIKQINTYYIVLD